MRALIQRVEEAQVAVDGGVVGSIGRGLLILLGVGQADGRPEADRLWEKTRKLRIFEDAAGKTNLSLADVGGQVLVVSQFTLYADCRHGNRPSFTAAGAPAIAEELYGYFCSLVERDLRNGGHRCVRGRYEGVARERRSVYGVARHRRAVILFDHGDRRHHN